MKTIIKYFLFIVISICVLVPGVKAIEKTEIDFAGSIITYSESNNQFNVNLQNYTSLYQWVKIADDGKLLVNAYNAYKDALISYQMDPTNTTLEQAKNDAQTNLENYLNISSVDDNAWQDVDNYYGDIVPGDKFVKWIKVTNNEDSSVIYGFGIYVTEGESQVVSPDLENPDTGINPLYFVPIVFILGSTLLFKKRRYE